MVNEAPVSLMPWKRVSLAEIGLKLAFFYLIFAEVQQKVACH